MHIASSVRAPPASSHCREAHEDGGFFSFRAEEGSCSDVAPVSVAGEDAVCAGSTGVDCSLRNLNAMVLIFVSIFYARHTFFITYPLVVEVLDLLSEDEVFKEGRSPNTSLQTELVFDGTADI